MVDAVNGREGVEKVEADREFDLVLMDIQFAFALLYPLKNSYRICQDAHSERLRGNGEDPNARERNEHQTLYAHLSSTQRPIANIRCLRVAHGETTRRAGQSRRGWVGSEAHRLQAAQDDYERYNRRSSATVRSVQVRP